MAVRTTGKYPDRDYTLKGLGMRVDALEDEMHQNRELIAAVGRLVKMVKIWGPILAASVLTGTAVNPNIQAALEAVFKAMGQ